MDEPVQQLRALLDKARIRGTHILNADISYAAKARMEKLIRNIADNPCDAKLIADLKELAALLVPLPLGLNLAEVQDTYWSLKRTIVPEFKRRAAEGDTAASECTKGLVELGEQLGFAPGALAQ